MASRPGSRETRSCSAVEVLSERVVMDAGVGWGIVSTDTISDDMNTNA
jgi:hypothetical protein